MLQRTFALIIGLLGVILAFIINLLYSSFHLLARTTGVSNDQTHFFWGLVVTFVGLIGSLLALFMPTAGVVLLVIAGIAFFFVAGWWALLVTPFLLFAAFLTFRYSKVQPQEYNPHQRQPVK
jgi:hypothetical protein